jgi:hypothetical protein
MTAEQLKEHLDQVSRHIHQQVMAPVEYECDEQGIGFHVDRYLSVQLTETLKARLMGRVEHQIWLLSLDEEDL